MKGQEDHLQISLSPPKKQRRLDSSEVPSLTYHKININSNCKGLCFRPWEAMIRSPPPAQTKWEAGSAGLWPEKDRHPPRPVPGRDSGCSSGRTSPPGAWPPPTRWTLGRHQGHSNWGHCLRRGSWTHETNLRTIRVKNSVKQLMNNFIAVPYGHPVFAVLG